MYSKFLKFAGLPAGAYEFLMGSGLFHSVSEDGRLRLLLALQHVHLKAGTRFITQGELGDCLYLIQNGSCSVSVERGGRLTQVALLGQGEVVGEMALLTGEDRSAHVCTETDVDLWKLDRKTFEDLCTQSPEVRHFLTDLITVRFSRSAVIADRTIGKYVINEQLGEGGWSFVFKGVHSSLNMPVAVKMLKHTLAMEPEFLSSFRNEAQIIAHLNHENIVKVYDIEQVFRTVFIVMEYLDGQSLQQIMQEVQSLPIADILRILLQVCRGLAYAHASGIVHGDIKPGNIYITTGNTAKIVDFGLACPSGTESTNVKGTPEYMSPEQIRMCPADARSDIYSLGIMAYLMITGEPPFKSNDLEELLRMQLDMPMPDPRLLVPDISDGLAAFVLKATAKDPGQRYQTASEAIKAVESIGWHLEELASDAPTGHRMTGLFLFYREDRREVVKHLMKDFTEELNKIGIRHHESDFDDV